MEQTTNNNREKIKQGAKRRLTNLGVLGKWLVIAVVSGVLIGGVSGLFARILNEVNAFRGENPWIFLGLPAAGLVIVFLYQSFGQKDGGTNQVLAMIRSRDDVSWRSAPLIFVSTILTQLAGGSAGREGAAIQLGGSIGNCMGKWLRMDDEDRHVVAMCGMSAAFAAMFGTPVAAAFFSMEVVSVGIMYYAALLPCGVAALLASSLAASMGVPGEAFAVEGIPAVTLEAGAKTFLLALGCAAVSVCFCMLLREVGKLYRRFLPNPYVRVLAASALILALTFLLRTADYMGSGTGLIERAVEEGKTAPWAFFWKAVLTALTMNAGFRGGEIVPSFCIGATFGCAAAGLLGMPPSFCAAVGMTAVFCGVTNCPVTSVLIALEMFGMEGAAFYLAAAAVSYAFSGHYSLYKAQRLMYSKYKAKYVNEKTK